MDLLQLAGHHILVDQIVPWLPLQALGSLQATCTLLRGMITALPEDTWRKAAQGQFPAHHPIFCSSRSTAAYLQLHHGLHRAFSQPQARGDRQPASLDLPADLLPSHDYSKAAVAEGQGVTVLALATWLPVCTIAIPNLPLAALLHTLHWSPSDTKICAVVHMPGPRPGRSKCRHLPPPLHSVLILDLQTATVSAPLVHSPDVRSVSWSPDSKLLWLQPQSGSAASIHDAAGRVLATVVQPTVRDCTWSPDSACAAAVAPDGLRVCMFDLKGGTTTSAVLPHDAAPVQSFSWAPNSALICCLTKRELTWISRQGAILSTCRLVVHPSSMCVGLGGAVTLHRSTFDPDSCIVTVFDVGAGPSLAQRYSVQLPVKQFSAFPGLSPDGSLCAFVLLQTAPDAGQEEAPGTSQLHTLVIICLETATTRTYELALHPSHISWAADGTAVFAADPTGRRCAALRLAD